MENKKRYLLIILGIVLISILGTFAWLTWKSKDTSLVLTIGDISGTTVTLKPYMIEQSLIPTLTYEGNDAVNVTAKNNGTTENDIVLYYKINNISEELITDSFKYTIFKSIDNGTTYEEYQTGNFASSVSGEELVILTETIPENTTYKYRVYTWLDGENETSSNIQGKSFKAELRASIFNGSVVIVDVPSGLIPVTIANDGTVTSILETDSSWYDYNNKLWANGVLVTESSRSTYLGTTGVEIPESDILAYYVYIPRYKYKIWTIGTSSAGNEQEIEILFENKNYPKSKGTRVGEYRTHPGFTFGSDELNGIWVGKFETTGTGNLPTVKPNTTALTNQTISEEFITSLKFAGGTLSYSGVATFSGSNTYGLSNEANSHMAKNTEWSAAAYLSHSKYGINTEVRINNYGNNNDVSFGTGCGASSANTNPSDTCAISYGSASAYPQSTTGNITGIFDMSGGAWEKVMGVFANSEGTLWSGNSPEKNSGFNGLLGAGDTSKINGIPFPESKYYDVYKASGGTTISELTACNSGYCYGHGLSEVSNWYENYSNFVSYGYPWFARGGGEDSGAHAGVFLFGTDFGVAYSDNGFRSILVKNTLSNTLYTDKSLNGADPELDEGMIPITFNIENGKTKVITADKYSKWYDYEDKEWANVVLVKESGNNTRKYYQENIGVEVPESDILAYYVWIPRYKYKIWTTGKSANGQEQEIEIVFETKDKTKSTGSQVGEYLTHPAFTFGNDELNGIWIGKFETTGTGDVPTVKPNVSSLRNQDVSTQFQASLKFAGGTLNNGITSYFGSNTYGLSNNTNAHMAKNTEWAAAAYLSHSKYGINSEVRINNYWNNETKTGCGASTANASKSTSCGITYGKVLIYPQSTTGNISGVFDMSGGAWEYVMGVFANSEGTLWSGNSTEKNSGFNGLIGTSGLVKSDGISFPEEKYYNVYKASSGTIISSLTACNGGYCYGHGLSEVSGWYGDNVFFVSSEIPWFVLGAHYGYENSAGIFSVLFHYGSADSNGSFRSIVIVN